MNGNHRFPNLSPELNPDDVFEEAASRLETGETIESIVASYPQSDTNELKDFLQIVQVAQQIQQEPIPRPNAAKRSAARQNFLNAAADLKQKELAAQANRPLRIAEPPRRRTVAPPPAPSLWGRFADGLAAVFSMRTLRLAPLIITLALVLLSASTFVTMAQSAVPGDLTYSFKQWMRKQELQLTPPDRREIVRQAQEQELAADVKKAAVRADNNSAVIQAEDTQVFYGRMGRLLKIGGLTVMDRYQPDANIEVFHAMKVDGDLVPGSTVSLIYQIMPGQSDTVQGISLSVVAPPAETPTPEAEAAPAAEAVQPNEPACTVQPPDGWVEYEVQVGDNLTFLAKRGDSSVEAIMAANCLDSETILIGAKLYVPALAVDPAQPIGACDAERPAGWVAYEVQVGDNLSVLAAEHDITIDELTAANCLTSDTIVIGSTLYLPGE